MGTGGLLGIFYDPIGTILGAISPALGDAWTTLTKWCGIYYVVEFLAVNIVEPIIQWVFDLDDVDKDIYEVSVLAFGMFNSELYPSTQLDLILKYEKDEDIDALAYVRKFAETGDKHFGLYYRNGKWYYENYLPDIRISGTTIDVNEIIRILKETYKYTQLFITDVLTTAPKDLDWCKWQLVKNYNYNYHADCLTYNDKYFSVKDVKYIAENNNFKVNFTPITKALRRVYNTIQFISYKASDADIKEYSVRKSTKEELEVTSSIIDTISVKTLYEDVKIVDSTLEVIEIGPATDAAMDLVYVTKLEMKQYYIAASDMLFRHEETETIYTPYEVTKDSVKPSRSHTINNIEVKGHYLKYNTVVRDTTKFLTLTGKELSTSKEMLGASIELLDEPIKDYIEQTTEVETELREFYHTVVLNRIVRTDANGVSLGTEDELISENYVLATADGREYEYVTLTNHIQISDNEIQREIKATETVTMHIDGSIVYDRVIVTEYDKQYIVDVGTSKDYTATTEVSETEIEMNNTETLTLDVEYHQQHTCYSVYYNANSERHIWIYDVTTNLYPSLSSITEHILNIEAYPVILLRNNYFDVRNYKRSNVNGKDRPNCVTEHRYQTTQTLLKKVGLDIETLTDSYAKNPDIDKVQDAFFAFGISPSNKNEIVSKTLYEMFDFISDKLPYIGRQAGCSCTFKEMPFNGSFIWSPNPVTFTKGTIGALGTHKHTISGSTLTIQKQVTLDEYKTITLTECRSFTIVRWDIANGGHNFDLGDKNLIIPLMVPVVERLSIIDRTKLFGESAYLLFYAFQHQHIHLEWYETEEFAAILGPALQVFTIIITVAVTAVSWWFCGPAGGMTVSMAVASITANLAIGVAITLCLRLVMENVQDTRLKMILAMGVVALGAICSMGVSAAFGSLTTASMLSTMATTMVEMASVAVNIYAQDYQMRLQRQFDDLQKQYNDFQRRYEDKAKELEKRTRELNSGLNASNMVGLIDMDNFAIERESVISAALMSPTQFFYASIDLYRNYDAMYSGYYDEVVHRFCQNKLSIGVNQSY